MWKVEDYPKRNRSLGFRVAEDTGREDSAILRAKHGKTGATFRGTVAARTRQGFEITGSDSGRAISIGRGVRQKRKPTTAGRVTVSENEFRAHEGVLCVEGI